MSTNNESVILIETILPSVANIVESYDSQENLYLSGIMMQSKYSIVIRENIHYVKFQIMLPIYKNQLVISL